MEENFKIQRFKSKTQKANSRFNMKYVEPGNEVVTNSFVHRSNRNTYRVKRKSVYEQDSDESYFSSLGNSEGEGIMPVEWTQTQIQTQTQTPVLLQGSCDGGVHWVTLRSLVPSLMEESSTLVWVEVPRRLHCN